MRVCIFEDSQVAYLEPLTLTRPAFELRCGARPLREVQADSVGASEIGVWVRPYLAEVTRMLLPGVAVNDLTWLRAQEVMLVNARWIPGPPPSNLGSAGFVGDELAYAQIRPIEFDGLDKQNFGGWITDQSQKQPKMPATGVTIRHPWDLIEHNSEMLCRDFVSNKLGDGSAPDSRGIAVTGAANLLRIHPSAVIEPMVTADTTRGPVVIDRDAVVKSFSRLEGPCYIGPGSWVVGAKIRGSTIGPMCRVGGEIEATIFHGYSNKYHDGFLGHSYVGEWVNLAAGTQVSDLRNDYGTVSVTVNGQRINTGLSKVGSFIGDHTKTGLGTLFNTGTAVGAHCNLLPSGELMPRTIPSFCRFSRGRIEPRSDWGELLTTAARVMQRREQEFTETHKQLINDVYEGTTSQRAKLRM